MEAEAGGRPETEENLCTGQPLKRRDFIKPVEGIGRHL